MEDILRAAGFYFFLLVTFRLAGKRTLAEVTNFDFVLVLIIGEMADQAILGENRSLTASFLVILTLLSMDQLTALLSNMGPQFQRILDGTPIVVFRDGKVLEERLGHEHLDVSDIETSAREMGCPDLGEVETAILETHGGISIIKKNRDSAG